MKRFQSKHAVSDINLTVEPSEIVGLLGPNGAGKTTTFYMMVGLLLPSMGQVFLNNQDITNLPIHRRAQLGMSYLPQTSSIFKKLTVEENLIVVMEICKIPKDQYSQLLDSIYTQFHLGNLRKSLGMSLSGGERRKVEIARSLILNPKFLLLDEPFAGIDPISIEEIQLLLKNLNLTQNIGILISDHNVRETLDICHKAYVLAEGRIICQGVPSHIIQDTNVQNLYLGSTFKI